VQLHGSLARAAGPALGCPSAHGPAHTHMCGCGPRRRAARRVGRPGSRSVGQQALQPPGSRSRQAHAPLPGGLDRARAERVLDPGLLRLHGRRSGRHRLRDPQRRHRGPDLLGGLPWGEDIEQAALQPLSEGRGALLGLQDAPIAQRASSCGAESDLQVGRRQLLPHGRGYQGLLPGRALPRREGGRPQAEPA